MTGLVKYHPFRDKINLTTVIMVHYAGGQTYFPFFGGPNTVKEENSLKAGEREGHECGGSSGHRTGSRVHDCDHRQTGSGSFGKMQKL